MAPNASSPKQPERRYDRPSRVPSSTLPRTVARVLRPMGAPDDERMRAVWMASAMEQDRYDPIDQDVSKETRAPWRIVSRYFRRKLQLGASVESILDVLEEWKSRVKAWAGALGNLPLSVAHRRLIAAECDANYWQALAVEFPTTKNLERALAKTQNELARETDYRDAVRTELLRRMNGLPEQPIAIKRKGLAS